MSRPAHWTLLAAGLLLLLAPQIIGWIDKPFYLDLITRIVILSIAAVSLNLILGYGGMISFGHAAFIGIGAYAVGIPAYYEEYSGLLQLGIALGGAGLFALVTGIICLRTRGIHFIMITLAFAQMAYFTFVSLDQYGGDDGLVIDVRSEFPGLIDLESGVQLYYLSLAALALALFLVHRLVHSRFGRVIEGARSNRERMHSLGYDTYRYQLVCYVIAGMLCGLSGWLLGNFTSFISPEMMDWTRSGELLFMVVLGGTGLLFGPVLGVSAFIIGEEVLSGITVYWQFIFGVILILVVLFARGGLGRLLLRSGDGHG
ncbi:MAG TPA: branched-chain amino acid ABC transporter permease [Sedimenticola thiotaurini]|uniref:Branched-chain amino acid ABC transporter permease n=1 Tax=Sedimenticola thiotaurini TaxID=1543721 RepID=A0A831W4B5_9GAMM|nr:branched-chain amino acid ABC transporter permease [Sedimenticola thiotaurini]